MKTENRNCQNCTQPFTIEPDDFAFYEKLKVPAPTWCPQCRFARRALFRNERKLFKIENGRTGEPLIALWPSDQGLTIYDDHDWWNFDLWNPLAYGQEFDEHRPFLSQLFEVFKNVPKMARNDVNMVNSGYSANAVDLKNCYLMFNSNHTEDSAYGNGVDYCRSCFDNSHVQKSERCYESFWLTNCYETHFSSQYEDCASVWFSKNCRGCTNCLGCVNLRTQKYCMFNEQLTKDEYETRLAGLKLNTWSGLQEVRQRAREFWLMFPNRMMQGVQNTNVSGEYITHSRNVTKSYLIRECENLKYVQYSQVPSSRDVMDATVIGNTAELFYEASVCGWGAANLKFCWDCWEGGRELEYCINCTRNAANLFGCVGISKHQYCILNKQYSKNDYLALRAKIIQHMNELPYRVKSKFQNPPPEADPPSAENSKTVEEREIVYKYREFFPPEFSPFAYQHTIVSEHFPMNKEEVEKFGARWQDPSPTEYQTTMEASALPDAIEDVNELILKQLIQCSECRRAYWLIQPELQFLKQVKIPAPRACVDCRHARRISQRNRSALYSRQCMCAGRQSAEREAPSAEGRALSAESESQGANRQALIAEGKSLSANRESLSARRPALSSVYTNTAPHFHGESPCPNEFETSYAPDRPEIVYCEQCYQSEVA